jgi:prevent-host-death family protein
VTTRDYIEDMKRKPDMRLTDGEPAEESSVVREIDAMPGVGEVISVRAAKAHLSGLLDLVERGREIIVTSGGKPKARLLPVDSRSLRRPFSGTIGHLDSMPKWKGGPGAVEIVRADREERGW